MPLPNPPPTHTMANINRKYHLLSLLFSTTLTMVLISLLLMISTTVVSGDQIYYTPLDNVALNCGVEGDTVALDTRKWTGDVSSKYLSSSSSSSSSSTSFALTQDSSVPEVPYMTARVFQSQFTYSFNVTTLGPKFVRLHFHPSSYSSTLPNNISNSYFTVTLNNFTILRNFSTLLAARSLSTTYFVKEYYVNMVSEPQVLNITFSPSQGAFAFINGIEVVSSPPNLYTSGENIKLVGQPQPYIIDNGTALEKMYRLNVGASTISPQDDTGMYREWVQDVDYIFGAAKGVEPYHFTVNLTYTKVPNYTAPEILYRTARSMGMSRALNENYNLTWWFPVDSGFYYLVRLHFCEVEPDITGINQRVFQIFLNNRTAEDQMDIMVYADRDRIGVPIFKDFIVIVPETGSKTDLWLALHPNTKARAAYSDALLNGVEIFKLSNSGRSLAGLNPNIPDPDVPSVKKQPDHHSNKIRIVFIIVGAVLCGSVGLSFFIFFFMFWRRSKPGTNNDGSWYVVPFSKSGSGTTKTSSLPSDLCRHFSLAEIKSATRDFSADLVIGEGGFGNVYKGYIDGGLTPVAIKRLNPSSQQGAHEFRTEIETLSRLRHLHLVSLIGYCADYDEMILVYDYMARGTIRDHLYNTDNPPLPWKLRLQICIGAARGLHYLHTGGKHTIIHRDVKTTNILLDEKWTAKVSDFGLSRVGPTDMSQTHVSTIVKGSFGYLDPEYYRRQQLTEKSDVYSFGVVLFEVLCGRPPLDKKMEKDEMCLSDWARKQYRKGKLDQIIDPYLSDKIAPESLRKFGEVADSCLLDQGIERPSMNDVVWNLEFALQLQESSEESGAYYKGGDDPDNEKTKTSSTLLCDQDQSFVSLDTNSNSNTNSTINFSINSTVGTSGTVFSEIMSPKAR